MNILEVQDLCKTYGTGETEVHALNHVSFSVRKGEFIAIIGESGSGKSTLRKRSFLSKLRRREYQ